MDIENTENIERGGAMPLLTPIARGPLAGVPPDHPDTLAKAICRDVPAMVVSLVVHCGVLVGLALVGNGAVSPPAGRPPAALP